MSIETSSPLQHVRDEIVADLEVTQGPWRRRGLLQRTAILVVPALLVVGAAFAILEPTRGMAAPVIAAGLSSLLALVAVALAPLKPALSERLAQVATVGAVGAFGIEVSRISVNAVPCDTVLCVSGTMFVAALSFAVTAAALRSSRMPLRPWHKIGLGVAASLGSCAAIWHHCSTAAVVHVLVAHALGPVVFVAVVVFVMGRLGRSAVKG